MRTRLKSRSGRLGLIAGLVALTAAGIAYAAIPDPGGTIRACYSLPLGPGALRVIDTAKGQHCKATEHALSWGQVGPTGPTGATGPSGPAGTAGPTSITNGGGTVDADGVTLLGKTIGATEAGLTMMSANVGLTDLSGNSGGKTLVNCFIVINGGGSGFTMVIQDNGEANPDNADREWATFADRDTLAEGDVVGVRCSVNPLTSDANEVAAQAQLVLMRVNS